MPLAARTSRRYPASTKSPAVGNDLLTVIEDLIDEDSEVLKASSELLHGL